MPQVFDPMAGARGQSTRVAILTDSLANPEALAAVLADLKGWQVHGIGILKAFPVGLPMRHAKGDARSHSASHSFFGSVTGQVVAQPRCSVAVTRLPAVG